MTIFMAFSPSFRSGRSVRTLARRANRKNRRHDPAIRSWVKAVAPCRVDTAPDLREQEKRPGDELDRIGGEREERVGILRTRYCAAAKEEAEKQVKDWESRQ